MLTQNPPNAPQFPETPETTTDLADVVSALNRLRNLLIAILVVVIAMFGWAFSSKQALHSCVEDAGYEITVGEATGCIAQN